jgi:hypothetical protein
MSGAPAGGVGAEGGGIAVNQVEMRNQTVDFDNIVAKEMLDCSGLQCPGPIMRVFRPSRI